jgi:transcriptional regulator with XRE-family HTH domain
LSILDFPISVSPNPERLRLWIDTEQYRVVGACLAAARRRANVTQQELARRLSKPQSFVSEYERGQRRIDVIEFLLISRTIGADPLDIFTEISGSTAI